MKKDIKIIIRDLFTADDIKSHFNAFLKEQSKNKKVKPRRFSLK